MWLAQSKNSRRRREKVRVGLHPRVAVRTHGTGLLTGSQYPDDDGDKFAFNIGLSTRRAAAVRVHRADIPDCLSGSEEPDAFFAREDGARQGLRLWMGEGLGAPAVSVRRSAFHMREDLIGDAGTHLFGQMGGQPSAAQQTHDTAQQFPR